jgi:hypothetical protein
MTLAIGHREGDHCVLDAVREVRPPFDPAAVVSEFCTLLKSYRINFVISDRYGGEWVASQFRTHGLHLRPSERSKSELFIDLLPAINSGTAALLDNDRLIAQLCALERRTSSSGKDTVDHPPGAHDDVANAVAGALVNTPSAARRDRPPGGVTHEGVGKYNPLSGTFGAQR